MESRRLGRSGLKVSPLGLGTARLAGLGWIWSHSPLAIPMPGLRSMEQMQELAQAQQFGPLPPEAMQAIAERVKTSKIAPSTARLPKF